MDNTKNVEIEIRVSVEVTDEAALRGRWLMETTNADGDDAVFNQSLEREVATDMLHVLGQTMAHLPDRGYVVKGMEGGAPGAQRRG